MEIYAIFAGLAAIGAAIFAAYRKGGKDKETTIKSKGLEDEKRRMDAGRDAVRDGRQHDPSDSLRRNDGSW